MTERKSNALITALIWGMLLIIPASIGSAIYFKNEMLLGLLVLPFAFFM